MTYAPVTKSTYALTNSLSTTEAIPFGQDAIIVQPESTLGSTTIYGSVDGENFAAIKDSSNADVTRTINYPSVHSIDASALWGIPYLKLVVTTGGNAKVTIVQGCR